MHHEPHLKFLRATIHTLGHWKGGIPRIYSMFISNFKELTWKYKVSRGILYWRSDKINLDYLGHRVNSTNHPCLTTMIHTNLIWGNSTGFKEVRKGSSFYRNIHRSWCSFGLTVFWSFSRPCHRKRFNFPVTEAFNYWKVSEIVGNITLRDRSCNF